MAFCGFALTALPSFLYLVDTSLYASFITVLVFYAVAAIALGRLLMMLLVAFLGQLSIVTVRGEKKIARFRRLAISIVISRSPIALQYSSIAITFVAFAYMYLGWKYAITYIFIFIVISYGTFTLLFRFRRQIQTFVRGPKNREGFMNLVSQPKVAFVLSTVLAALAFSLGMTKANAVFVQEKIWICGTENSFEASVIGRSFDGLVVVIYDSEGELQRVSIIDPKTEGLSFTGIGSDCQ